MNDIKYYYDYIPIQYDPIQYKYIPIKITTMIDNEVENKPNINDIIHCNYIPIQITSEISKYLDKQKYAGKTFASVKCENKNPFYRLKRGEVLETTNDSCLLEIETVNRVSDDGCSTLIGVIYPYGYEKIWFKKDELEKFEIYDEDGNIQ